MADTSKNPALVNLTKAIALGESGNGGDTPDYNAVGDNGTSRGAYQWQPGNFEKAAKQFGFDPNDFSPANQNRVAYAQVEDMYKRGFTPAQIPAAWNAGEDKAKDGSWETNIGTTTINGKDIPYNTPAYVAKVNAYYKKLAGAPAASPTAPGTPPAAPAAPAASPSVGGAVSEGAGGLMKVLGSVASGIGGFVKNVAHGVAKGGVSTVLNAPATLVSTGGLIESGLDKVFGTKTAAGPLAQAEKMAVGNQPALQPKGAGENIGYFGEKLGEFAAPGGAVKDARAAIDAGIAGKGLLKGAARVAGKVAAEGVAGGAVTAAQTGSAPKGAEAAPAFSALGALGEGASALKSAVAPSISKIAASFTGAAKTVEDVEKPLNQYIVDTYSKAFRKALGTGKKTFGAVERGASDIAAGVRAIVENKDALVDEAGKPMGLPKTRQEFASAVDQTKTYLYKQYDALAKAAGGKGSTFDASPIISKMESYIKNSAGKTDAQIKAMQTRLSEVQRLDGQSFEKVSEYLKTVNGALSSFFSTGAERETSDVLATIASEVRGQADKQISTTEGGGYAQLRKAFGAVKSLEKTVAQSIGKEAGNRGLERLTNVFSGEEILTGLATFNPAEVTRGISLQAVKSMLKWLGSPDRAISNMFQTVDETYAQSAARGLDLTPRIPSTPQLALPPGRTPGATVEVPMNMPERSQSTVDAQEQARIQSQRKSTADLLNGQ